MSRLAFSGTITARPAVMAFALAASFTAPSHAVLRHQYLFNTGDGTQILDSVGTAHGSALNGAVVSIGDSRLVLDGVDDYAALPGPSIAVNTYSAVSLEMWLAPGTINNNRWTVGAHLGRTSSGANGELANLGYDYLMLQPTRAPNGEGSRGAISNGTFNAEVGVTNGSRDLADGQLHHIVLTVDSTTVGYYVDGLPIGTAPLGTFSLANVSNDLAYLGRSLYPDPYLQGSIYEFRIFDNALPAAEVTTRFQTGCVDSCGEPLRLEIDRATGIGTFKNNLSSQGVVAYSVASAAGALRTQPGGWNPIATSGADPNDTWSIGTNTNILLEESDPLGGGGPDDGVTIGSPVSIGALWNKSPFEDLVVTATTFDGITETTGVSVPVRFIGNGGAAFSRSDLDVDGDLDGADYTRLLDNHLEPLTGTTRIETFALGDIDGDLDNDFNDFRLFKNDFIAANGAAAFAALQAVPEPTSAVMAVLATALLATRRRVS